MKSLFTRAALLLSLAAPAIAQPPEAPDSPTYLWYEPEWFADVEGSFGYWSGFDSTKPSGHWGVAGPGISAEFTQGGESEWNSMGAPAAETNATATRPLVVPRAGKYRVWVRYFDHRDHTEPFSVQIEQAGKAAVKHEFGVQPALPPNDEYQLYWGFSFAWASAEADLKEGPATLKIVIDKPGERFRQVDAVLITDDLSYEPHLREKPPFAYFDAFALEPKDGATWRGEDTKAGETWKRPAMGGRDFAMWVTGRNDPKDPPMSEQTVGHFMYLHATNAELKEEFRKQFANPSDAPLVNWEGYFPGFYLGDIPDLSPGSPTRAFLERTKAPFYIMTNYANPAYKDQAGPETYAALTGALKDQFLGYVHGEAFGTLTVHPKTHEPMGKTRREHIDAFIADLKTQQTAEWSKFYQTQVPAEHWNKGIACLSCDSIALAHAMLESGRTTCAYELDATNAHANMRIAFHRGAARQYGAAWINYASGNFGDACNYFSKTPPVARGSDSWWHSKYAVTDGVPTTWYRKLYYMNYLGGASAIYWEQALGNQWIKPGPGQHPVQLSPFGRATEDFQNFVSRLPGGDRGEPYTPVAVLLSYGHGYEPVNYQCRMLHAFPEDQHDRELRELFSVLWHPATIRTSEPITPEKQSMQPGVYGDIYDVLVDRPERMGVLANYQIVMTAGDVALTGKVAEALEKWVRDGGTLVTNVEHVRGTPIEKLTGLQFATPVGGIMVNGRPRTEGFISTRWHASNLPNQIATPFGVLKAELGSAESLAEATETTIVLKQYPLITRNKVGNGAVITTLVPHMMGLDERAHPAMAYLMNGLTQELLPVEVRSGDGSRPDGDVMYSLNKTKDGFLVALYNNHGVDKTQNGVARVDRTKFIDVIVRTKRGVKSAKEFTQPRDLKVEKDGDARTIRVRVHPGDVQVIGLVMD